MSFQGEPRWPVRVGAISPRYFPPAGIHEIDRLGDFVGAENFAKDIEDLVFGQLIRLFFNHAGLVGNDSCKENAAPRQEIRDIKGLKNGVIAAFGMSVKEVLHGLVPEYLVGRELEEDLGVDTHLEGLDGDLLPAWKGRGEFDFIRLEHPNREGTYCIVSFDTCSVGVIDCNSGFTPFDFSHNRVQKEPGIIGLEERGGFAMKENVVTTLVVHKIINFGKPVICRILHFVS